MHIYSEKIGVTPKKPPTPKKQVSIKNTEIDDLEEEEEDPRPPAGVRNGAGSYDFDNNFGKEQERKIEPNKDNNSGLMATALAIQKERESS